MGNVIVTASIITVIAIVAVAFLFNAPNTGLFVADFSDSGMMAVTVSLGIVALSVLMAVLWNR
jgi:hypothetical protein